MQVLIAFIIGMALFSQFHPNIREIPKNEIYMNVGVQQPILIRQSVKSLKELEDQHVVKQEYDFSCGSAALATLLNYYLGEDFSERQVISGLMTYGNQQQIAKRRAFSLLDMKKFVDKLGYRGVGYKADIKDLESLKEPCILPIHLLGYRHFTVFRGIHDGHVFLADPFKGNTSYTIATFKDLWFENVIFVVYPNGAPELNALRLTTDDMRYIDEFEHENILDAGQPLIPQPDERRNTFTLPDDYHKYNPY